MKNTTITLEQLKNTNLAIGLTSHRSSTTGAKFVKIVDLLGNTYGSCAAVGTSRQDQALKQFIYSISDISEELKKELGNFADSGYFTDWGSLNMNSLNYLAKRLGFNVCNRRDIKNSNLKFNKKDVEFFYFA